MCRYRQESEQGSRPRGRWGPVGKVHFPAKTAWACQDTLSKKDCWGCDQAGRNLHAWLLLPFPRLWDTYPLRDKRQGVCKTCHSSFQNVCCRAWGPGWDLEAQLRVSVFSSMR